MSREILFRAAIDSNVDSDRNGEFVTGYYYRMVIGGNERHFIMIYDDTTYRVDPKTVSIDLNIQNRDQIDLFTNDVVLYNGKEYVIKTEMWRSTIERSLSTHGENEIIVMDEDVAWECKVINSIHEVKNES
jgi:hypothetical protein